MMSKHIFVVLFWLGGSLTLPAQTFQDYIAKFPTLSGTTTWQDADIAALPSSQTATLPANLYKFIGGGGQWGKTDSGYSENIKLYPIGKIEAGNAVIVFIAATSYSYKANYDTQIAVTAYSYNKKNGDMLRGGVSPYLFSVGGDPVTHTFMYTGKVETDGKTWLKVYQTGTGSAVKTQHAYKISGKGLSFDKEF